MYFLNYFEIVPIAPVITGITFDCTVHMRCISTVRSSYFGIFSASFLITFLSLEIIIIIIIINIIIIIIASVVIAINGDYFSQQLQPVGF